MSTLWLSCQLTQSDDDFYYTKYQDIKQQQNMLLSTHKSTK